MRSAARRTRCPLRTPAHASRCTAAPPHSSPVRHPPCCRAVRCGVLQVLRYQPGEYYREHHDWVDAHTQFPFGPRVFTFFLYLSDVEEGGGTHFPALNITVQPKLGRALWWPSVLEATPDKQDSRTTHEAQPVVRGMKRAANVWIHLYDFMTPYSKGCAP